MRLRHQKLLIYCTNLMITTNLKLYFYVSFFDYVNSFLALLPDKKKILEVRQTASNVFYENTKIDQHIINLWRTLN